MELQNSCQDMKSVISQSKPASVDLKNQSDFKIKNNPLMTYFNSATNGFSASMSQYNIFHSPDDVYNEDYWSKMFPSACYFHVYNSVLGDVFAMVYKPPSADISSTTLSVFIVSKHGCSVHPSVNISPESKYYAAVHNLNSIQKNSKVRKALAVSLLKSFADLNVQTIDSLYKQAQLSNSSFDWDETQAGLLASQMKLLDSRTPADIGSYLFSLGYLTPKLSTASYVVDIIYNDNTGDETISENNNCLALLLGKQLEQLFDPLTEYSPEPTEKVYKAPTDNSTNLSNEDSELIQLICSELITVQTNYTVSLVNFLQNYIIPLRIKILENKIPTISSARMNSVFPPTIDEVTRINCIFLDMLNLAKPYGSYEILKACATTIPYFYKAQMRHEAAIKNFNSNYNEFILDLKRIGHEDSIINYDQRKIETCVYSSLNLVKIQLIIQRLAKNNIWPVRLQNDVNNFLISCDNTISSFANDKLSPYNGRIFTPTGKILTEIAKGWPSELQYGWLTRRVVAVFDAIDILLDDVKNRSVIIIFSDTILFLSIDDEEYYSELWNTDQNEIHKPSIADVLNHSLTNETPLTQLPHMSVKFWVNINDLHALYFTNNLTPDHSISSFVRFFNEKDPLFTGIYQLDKVSGKYVTEVIARAKVLNKSQSFHLFVGNDNDTIEGNKKVYYTAHELSTYAKEETKSPFIILFNEKYREELLSEYNVYAFLTLNFIDDDTVKIEGLSRCHFDDNEGKKKISYEVNVKILNASLLLILNQLFSTHLSIYNPMMVDYLLLNNGFVNAQANKVLNLPLETLETQKQHIIKSVEKLKNERLIVEEISKSKLSKRKSLDALAKKSFSSSTVTATNKSSKERKGFLSKLFSKGPKSMTQSERKSQSKSSTSTKNIAKPNRVSSVIRKVSIKREINYEELKPAKPKKRLSQSFTNNKKQTNYNTIVDDNTTASASIYVNSHFEFPMEPADSACETFNPKPQLDSQNRPINKPYKYASLKTNPGHQKGYKDSVDLMGQFMSTKLTGTTSMTGQKNNYDDDLFELVGEQTKKTALSDDGSIFSKPAGEIESTRIVTPVTVETSEEKPLKRSDSLYIRFLGMREKQDKMLENVGISPIVQVDGLDRDILSSGYIFKSYNSGFFRDEQENAFDEDDDGSYKGHNWVTENSEEDINAFLDLSKKPKVNIIRKNSDVDNTVPRAPVSNDVVDASETYNVKTKETQSVEQLFLDKSESIGNDLLGDVDLSELNISFKNTFVQSESTREFAQLLNEKSYAYLNDLLEKDDLAFIRTEEDDGDRDYDLEYSKKLLNSSVMYLSSYLS